MKLTGHWYKNYLYDIPADKAVFRMQVIILTAHLWVILQVMLQEIQVVLQAQQQEILTATAFETARTIGGVSFDGTGNINLPGVIHQAVKTLLQRDSHCFRNSEQ